MKDDIKEILDNPKILMLSYGNYILLDDYFKLKDYITNLQEQLEVLQTNEETYRLEMQDITKILGLNEHTMFDEVKEYAINLQEENERLKDSLETMTFTAKIKQEAIDSLIARIDKAIEYIKSRARNAGVQLMPREKELLEILVDKGEDNE